MTDHTYRLGNARCPNCGAAVAMDGSDYVECEARCGYRRAAGDEEGRQEEHWEYRRQQEQA